MKQNLNPVRIIVKLRCAYAFQCASTWETSSDDYFGLMTEALYEFACANMQIQKAVLQDRLCRAAVAAWIEHTGPASVSAEICRSTDEDELSAAKTDSEISAFMKTAKNFTPENILSIFCSAEDLPWFRWTDQTITQTPGHRQIGMYLGKHYGTRRRLVPSGERRIRGAC
jgi:hypothetical protein